MHAAVPTRALRDMQAWDHPEGLGMKVRIGFLDHFVLGMEVVKERRKEGIDLPLNQATVGDSSLVIPRTSVLSWSVGWSCGRRIHPQCLFERRKAGKDGTWIQVSIFLPPPRFLEPNPNYLPNRGRSKEETLLKSHNTLPSPSEPAPVPPPLFQSPD